MVSPTISKTLRLLWPTDYPVTTQAFSANPDVYSQLNLPGYDGVDLRAPFGTPVYAAADGSVVGAEEKPHWRCVSISHAGGYLTEYANLAKIMAKRGQKVQAGQAIAISNGFLKFALKKQGATASGLTHFPEDIIDPTPFLAISKKTPKSTVFPWPAGHCLTGMNLIPGESDIALVKDRQLEAVAIDIKSSRDDITRLRQINSALFIMTRIHLQGNRVLPAEDWAAGIRPYLKKRIEAGITFFEVHRTPNLAAQGAFSSWQNGREFAHWWLDVVALLKQDAPEGQFGFPAPSPGALIPGQRLDAATFQNEADEAMLSADWISMNCFWSTQTEMEDRMKGACYKSLRDYFPNHLFFITEFTNIDPSLHTAAKERERARFYSMVREEPGIGAAFARS
ncbi:MAG: M23 family metallopeptidase [Anaerolineales bacterium]